MDNKSKIFLCIVLLDFFVHIDVELFDSSLKSHKCTDYKCFRSKKLYCLSVQMIPV